MPSMKKILVPVDFSAGSNAAVEHALELAKSFGGTIDLLHTWLLPAHLDVLELQSEGRWKADDLVKATGEEISRMMTKFVDALSVPEGVTVNPWVEQGEPAAKIAEASAGYDLVVMSTHGRSGVSRMVLGSIATKVIRNAACPVLTVRMSPDDLAAEKAEEVRARNPTERVALFLFEGSTALGEAYRALLAQGVSMDALSLITTEDAYKDLTPLVARTHTKEGVEAGTLVGGAFGGALGLLAVIGSALAANVALLVLGPAVAFAAAGGLVGGLMGWGVPSDRAKRIEAAIHEGHGLLALHYHDEAALKLATKVADEFDGESLED